MAGHGSLQVSSESDQRHAFSGHAVWLVNFPHGRRWQFMDVSLYQQTPRALQRATSLTSEQLVGRVVPSLPPSVGSVLEKPLQSVPFHLQRPVGQRASVL